MIHIVYGTRAELIKFSYLIKKLQRRRINFKLIDTGQHDTSYLTKNLGLPNPHYFLGESLRKFWIKPIYFLGILISLLWGLSVYRKMRKIFREEGSVIVFHGNAMSVQLAIFSAKFAKSFFLTGIFSAIIFLVKILISKLFKYNFSLKIPFSNHSDLKLVHFESGLRGHTNESFLVDTFYKIADHNSDILFIPAKPCRENLEVESAKGKIIFTGDTFFDVIKSVQKITPRANAPGVDYVLVTLTLSLKNSDRMKVLSEVLSSSPYKIILALNKRMREKLIKAGVLGKLQNDFNIKIISPISYVEFLNLEKNAVAVITDSNGVQEECNFFNKPCIVLNDFIQFPELEQNGIAKVTGYDKNSILQTLNDIKNKKGLYLSAKNSKFKLGDSHATKKAVDFLERLK